LNSLALVLLCRMFAWTHDGSCREIFVSLFSCRNSLVRKSGRELFTPLIDSISKSKADKIACHLAKICFETRFWTSFCKISFADLQSIRKRNFLINRSCWKFETHKTIAKISFSIVEYFCCGPCHKPEWKRTNYSIFAPNLCLNMPP